MAKKTNKEVDLEEDAVKHFVSLVNGSEDLALDAAGEEYTHKVKKENTYAGRHIVSQEKKPRF